MFPVSRTFRHELEDVSKRTEIHQMDDLKTSEPFSIYFLINTIKIIGSRLILGDSAFYCACVINYRLVRVEGTETVNTKTSI